MHIDQFPAVQINKAMIMMMGAVTETCWKFAMVFFPNPQTLF